MLRNYSELFWFSFVSRLPNPDKDIVPQDEGYSSSHAHNPTTHVENPTWEEEFSAWEEENPMWEEENPMWEEDGKRWLFERAGEE